MNQVVLSALIGAWLCLTEEGWHEGPRDRNENVVLDHVKEALLEKTGFEPHIDAFAWSNDEECWVLSSAAPVAPTAPHAHEGGRS